LMGGLFADASERPRNDIALSLDSSHDDEFIRAASSVFCSAGVPGSVLPFGGRRRGVRVTLSIARGAFCSGGGVNGRALGDRWRNPRPSRERVARRSRDG
jgi:hypothetical protein